VAWCVGIACCGLNQWSRPKSPPDPFRSRSLSTTEFSRVEFQLLPRSLNWKVTADTIGFSRMESQFLPKIKA
jgi:hypothetical protein